MRAANLAASFAVVLTCVGTAAWTGCSAPADSLDNNSLHGGGGSQGGGMGPGTSSGGSGNGSGGASSGGASGGGGSGGTSSGGTTGGSGGTSSGGTSSGGGATGQAKAYYVSTVHPMLNTECGGCHTTGASGAPKFMATDPMTSYATLDQFGFITSKTTSPLPNHGPHTGPAMSATLLQNTGTWLDMEVKERGGKSGGPTIDQVMTQFGQCITETEFESRTASGKSVADIALIQTINRGPCQSCHGSGGMDFWASNAQGGTAGDWQANQKIPYLYKLVTATPGPNGTFTFSSDQNRVAAKKTAANQCWAAGRRDCHPDIQADLTAYITALQTMTTEVAAKMAAGQCGALPPAPTQ